MKIKVLVLGKTDAKALKELIQKYESRLRHYIPFSMEIIPDLKNTKNLSISLQKEKEGQLILNKINTSDRLFLLDEKGKDYDSIEFSMFLQKQMNSGLKQMVIVIGGPYGFSEAVYKSAHGKISFSKMTFSHQMIRLFVVEQLYRGMSILKNEPYHHQ
ncbi:MAG: 23S rRNA (pseudouridine(1915)-N(3))-methyltransferase RlmH [Flavobacteriaceae bacterium]|nr:23S rRNA (pseudouridine(1915)-N(3))-methyltransferase RlmH [Flavobacteriaceae bacterium]